MRYGTLTGLKAQLSRITLGTAWFGTVIAEEEAFRLMDAYAECGGNFLDSAHMYAGWVPGGAGKSESTIGRWLKRTGARTMRIATKGADRGMNRSAIRKQLAESLDRLGRDRIDFYWLHRDDPAVPVAEIVEWLNELRAEGRFQAFGCSNWRVTRIREAQAYAARRQCPGFSASQIGWSLARVQDDVAPSGDQVYMDDETSAYHRQARMPVVAYSSQAGGFFAGNYDPEGPTGGGKPNPNIVQYYGTPANYARLALAKQLAAAKGATPNQVALAYLLHESFPVFPIVGANSVARIRDCCGAAEVTLTTEEIARLTSPDLS